MKRQDTKILDAIRHEFSRRRGRPIPEGLRRLALEAVRHGHTASEIARAAGISRQSVRNWKRAVDVIRTTPPARPTPVELKVIDAPARSHCGVDESVATARITLKSGAIVEMPGSLLDVRWLVALNGSVS
jgi:transposase-like protein